MNNGDIVIKEVLLELKKNLDKKNFRNNTVEIINAHLTLNPKQSINYGKTKPVSKQYVVNELAWYLSKDLSIKGHKGIETNKIWQSCATDRKKLVNSNYGYLVFHNERKRDSQFDYAVKRLVKDKFTRQSMIIYTRPSIQWECDDGKHAKHDFICTTHTQHFINNKDELIYIVNMRSNDAIFGLQNDFEWHRYVYNQMYHALKTLQYPNLKVGKIYWNAGSLHLYERHYDLLRDICKEYQDKQHIKKLKDFVKKPIKEKNK